MIEVHEFDSAWRGREIGIVRDAKLFNKEPSEIEELCRPYEWVEFRTPTSSRVPIVSLVNAGFAKLDTQVSFRLDMNEFPPDPVPDLMTSTFAELETMPDLSRARPFIHERFARLPHVDEESLKQRYASWAVNLCETAPEWCVAVSRGGKVQGWYFSGLDPDGSLDLTLGAASMDSEVSGAELYRAAFARYFEDGARVGSASFSAGNMAAMNIYSSLRARFTGATDFWLRVPAWGP